MKMFVYIDGEKMKSVEVDIFNMEDIKRVLKEEFDCDELSDNDFECSNDGEEIYIGISEVEYLLNK